MQSRLSWVPVVRASALALALCFAAGCEAAPVAGAACDRASDCSSPLVCSYARCRVECRETRDCPLGARCIASAGLGVCTLAVESQCDTEVCPAPLLCVADQCRTECSTNAQCISGNCVMSTCVEPVSGVDAGMAEDAGTDAYVLPDAGLGTCAPAPESVAALVGPGRGLRATLRTVADLSTASPPALAVSTTRASGLAGSYVATIDYVATSDDQVPQLFHATTVADPFIPLTAWPTQGTEAWSIDAVVDGDSLLVMFMRQPADGGDAFAWAIETLTTDAVDVHGLSPNRTIGASETFHGELAIVGGGSPFGGTSMDVFYVFHTELDGVGTIGATDRSRSGGQWRTPPMLPSVYGSELLEMTATHGPLVVFRDPSSGSVGYWLPEPWNSGVGTPTAGTAEVVTLRTANVLPALAASLDGSTSVLAWAAGNAVEVQRIACGSDMCGAPSAPETVAAGSSQVVAVTITALAEGYVLAVGRDDGSVDIFFYDDEASTAEPFAAVSSFTRSTGNDTIRRLDVSATPTDAGATVLLGVLSDDATTRHVWTASYEVCDLP